MIHDLDATIKALLTRLAPKGSMLEGAKIEFDIPDAAWRAERLKPTVNCYLYDIHENRQLKVDEPIVARDAKGNPLSWQMAPRMVDCTYCITAWSMAKHDAALEEHQLLGELLQVFLRLRTISKDDLQGALKSQRPPLPTILASQEGVKNQAEFWHALDQRLKPSLNYVVTLAFFPEAPVTTQRSPKEPILIGVEQK